MNKQELLERLQSFDDRRDILIPGEHAETLAFCVNHFIAMANEHIEDHGYFSVALSGGSTPAAIYKGRAEEGRRDAVDWTKVLLFWSDERSVPPNDPESNYHMAMEAGLSKLGLPPEHIFRMHAEEHITAHAQAYEDLIKKQLRNGVFDMIMLGVGGDGHTASLFPHTHGLHVRNRLVISNWIPQLNTWRMSLTFECINAASTRCLYVLGKSKAKIVAQVLAGHPEPDLLPSQRVGTASHKALWILDTEAAKELRAQT